MISTSKAAELTATGGADATASVPAEHAHSFKRRALKGSVWVTLGYFAGQAIRLGSNLILTRLLTPEAFGLMAVINMVIRGLKMFSDLGINVSVIQNRRGETSEFLNTAWTLQIVRGFVLFAAAALLAWPLSLIYHEPLLKWLLLAASFTVVISGYQSTRILLLNRRLELGKLTLLDLSQQFVSLVVMVAWALAWPSVWALVVGAIVGTLFRTIATHVMVGGERHHFAWEKESLQVLVNFAIWISICTALTFASNSADRFILASLFGFQLLGVFSMARFISEVPRDLVLRLTRNILLPVASHRQTMPRPELRLWVIRHRGRFLLLLGLGIAMLTAVSDQVILILYDTRWEAAAWMLPILLLGLWPRILSDTLNPILLAVGSPKWNTYGSLWRLIMIVFGLPAGYYAYGIPGVVGVVAAADIPNYLVTAWGASKEELSCHIQDLYTTLWFVVSFCVMVVGRYLMGYGLPFTVGSFGG